MSRKTRGPVHWIAYAGARSVVTVLEWLPISFSFRFGRLIGGAAWFLFGGKRRVVKKNLRIVLAFLEHAEPSEERILQDAKEVFKRTGANLLSGFCFLRMTPEVMAEHLELDGLEEGREIFTRGKGAILILSHMGPWEALTQLPALLRLHGIDVPSGSLYRPIDNDYLDEWIKRDREARGMRLFSRKDGFHAPAEFVRVGGILGVLADQRAGRGDWGRFFGRYTVTTPLPGLLHRRTGAPLIALGLETIGLARWRIKGFPIPDPDEAAIANREGMAALCNKALETSLALSVVDGFWFHDRFRDDDRLYWEKFAPGRGGEPGE